MSLELPMPPPPPPPPPGLPLPAVSGSKKKLYQAIAAGKSAIEGHHAEARLLLSRRESWCGLVALWMAAHLKQPELSINMETIVQTALSRGYTVQGEMFSAHNMALLAEEVCACKAQLLMGGMSGDNAATIIAHICDGQPILIPYDEDFNHEPCQRSGHRAHWAAVSGVLLGLNQESLSKEHIQFDLTLPWLYLPKDTSPPFRFPTSSIREAYVLAKQGKSLRYQLWCLDSVAQSNDQLREMDPHRAGDGTQYVVPQGGVEAGLAGQVVLLHTKTHIS
ncbi:actin maturation protease isoform X2 [Lampris incognitus]|uniref:actin maturation protease isoform X2 n=1 Tax=Lampris incognitus TaxID=2546036 RepID=UPI0024B59626|nr:actin maturation protease isoform X2 [Lampris incognitus]